MIYYLPLLLPAPYAHALLLMNCWLRSASASRAIPCSGAVLPLMHACIELVPRGEAQS